jgi:D-aminopeptidase
MRSLPLACLALALSALACTAVAADKPRAEKSRARALGIPFDGKPGAANAITDVSSVTVGYSTVIEGSGRTAVRSGVTAILPRGRASAETPVFAGVFSLNGNGEMTGTHWIEESGFLEGPILITGTHSVGVVRDAVIAWRVKQRKPDATGYWWSLPVVAETWDGELSDANGFHIKPEHTFAALDSAASGPIAEGNVGGGTAMICHEFKCGTGTSSRIVEIDGKRYVLGTLVQANYGVRSELRIAGVAVGKFMPVAKPESPDQGSIIIVIATDAPLLPQQLKRLARRASLGLARNGSYSGDGSGDIFIAFSTANEAANQVKSFDVHALANGQLNPLFLATVQSVEESIVNALVAADTMTGLNGTTVPAIDTSELRKILKRFARQD